MRKTVTAPLVKRVYTTWRPHVVDQLIAERASTLRDNPAVWRLVRNFAYPLLGYKQAVRMADTVAPMSGRMAINWMSAVLRLRIDVARPPALPASGPVVIVANHPGGIADGVAVWDAVVDARPDLAFFANMDALRVAPRLAEVIVPVEWRPEARTRDKTRATLRAAADMFRLGRTIVVFPAGSISQWSWRSMRLEDASWASTAVTMARKHKAPIIPVGVGARMSPLYYGFAQVSEALKNMTVFHELLRARHSRYRLRFGDALDPSNDLPSDPAEAAARLRRACQALSRRF